MSNDKQETHTDTTGAPSDRSLLQDYQAERKQIGPRVRGDLWEDFKDYAKQVHDKQGMTSVELERAMVEYMGDNVGAEEDEDDERDMSDRLDVLNAKLDSVLVAVNQ